VEKYYTAGQATVNNMAHAHFACWIPKATNTNSQYAILIAFPLQQRLHERAAVLRYAYSGCIVHFFVRYLILQISSIVYVRLGTMAYGNLTTDLRGTTCDSVHAVMSVLRAVNEGRTPSEEIQV
jgi:hypothetical protein